MQYPRQLIFVVKAVCVLLIILLISIMSGVVVVASLSLTIVTQNVTPNIAVAVTCIYKNSGKRTGNDRRTLPDTGICHDGLGVRQVAWTV